MLRQSADRAASSRRECDSAGRERESEPGSVNFKPNWCILVRPERERKLMIVGCEEISSRETRALSTRMVRVVCNDRDEKIDLPCGNSVGYSRVYEFSGLTVLMSEWIVGFNTTSGKDWKDKKKQKQSETNKKREKDKDKSEG
ncbi:hypothetical protein Tco_0719399 [Tanacetum coccineum]